MKEWSHGGRDLTRSGLYSHLMTMGPTTVAQSFSLPPHSSTAKQLSSWAICISGALRSNWKFWPSSLCCLVVLAPSVTGALRSSPKSAQ